jgi:hypothetical protein
VCANKAPVEVVKALLAAHPNGEAAPTIWILQCCFFEASCFTLTMSLALGVNDFVFQCWCFGWGDFFKLFVQAHGKKTRMELWPFTSRAPTVRLLKLSIFFWIEQFKLYV